MKKWITFLLVMVMLLSSYGIALADTIRLPSQLKQIGDEAFCGDTSLDEVDIPWGTTAIGSRAFANSGIRRIQIPDTVSVIADDAFEGALDVIIVSSSRSYAKAYAKAKALNWEDSETPIDMDELDDFLDDDSVTGIQETFLYFSDETGYVEQLKASVEEYGAAVEELAGMFSDLASVLSSSSITVQGADMSFSVGSFQYNLSGAVSAGEYEIVSTEVVGNSVQTEILLNGVTSYIIRDHSGTRISATPAFSVSTPLRSRSADSFLTNVEKLFDTISDWTGRVMNAVGQIDTGIAAAVRKAESVYEAAKQERWIAFSAGHLAEQAEKAQKNLDAATRQLNNVKWVQEKWSKWVLGNGRKLGIAGSTIGITQDITRYFSKIKPLYNHGHPTKLEAEDTYAVYLADTLDRSCRSATLALVTDAASNLMSIILECSGMCSKIAACIPGAQPVALTLGLGVEVIKSALDLVVSTWGTVNSCMADSYIRTAESTDAKLHTIVCGYVTDAETNEPLENVGVTNGDAAVVTGKTGYYKIYLDPGKNTLLFNLKGYKKKNIDVTAVQNKQIQKDVELQPKTIILTREDLEAVAEDPESDYIVGADIDLSDAPWTPLPVLKGTLDGDGHTISGMRVEGTYADTNVGLFSVLEGKISNLNMTGVVMDIHAEGQFCNVFTFGIPNDLWNTGASETSWQIDNCCVSAVVSIHADEGCWTGYSPLTAARKSTSTAHINIWGTNITQNVLWNCSRCTANGSVNVTYTGQPQASISLIQDCLNSTADFILRVDQNGQSLENSSVCGIRSQNILNRGNTVNGSIYHESYTSAVWGGDQGADNCESNLYMVSDRAVGLYGCTNSRLNGTLKTIGNISDVYVNFIQDAEGSEERGNTCDAEYEYQESAGGMKPANLNMYCLSGPGTVFNTPIILENISLTNVSVSLCSATYQEGRYEGAEQKEQFRNGDIRVKTSSGFINIYSELSTNSNTYAESVSGKITVMAGSYNTGNVTGKSEKNTVQVNGGSKYNSGAVLGISYSGSGTSYVDGVYGTGGYNIGTVTGVNYGAGTVGIVGVNGTDGWNEGTVHVENRGSGNVYADGVYGDNGVNKGEVTAVGYGTTDSSANGTMGWNISSVGVNGSNGWNDAPVSASCDGSSHVVAVGCSNGVNLGKITSTAGTGYTNAIGIRGGTHNAGEVSTTTGGSVARAWGTQSGGTNSAKVSSVVMRSDIYCDAYADAQGGTAYASGGKAHATGRNSSAQSTYSGQTVRNGYAWVFVAHNHGSEIICNPPLYRVTETSDGSYPYHTYMLVADSQLTSDSSGSVPTVPTKPEVSLPF